MLLMQLSITIDDRSSSPLGEVRGRGRSLSGFSLYAVNEKVKVFYVVYFVETTFAAECFFVCGFFF